MALTAAWLYLRLRSLSGVLVFDAAAAAAAVVELALNRPLRRPSSILSWSCCFGEEAVAVALANEDDDDANRIREALFETETYSPFDRTVDLLRHIRRCRGDSGSGSTSDLLAKQEDLSQNIDRAARKLIASLMLAAATVTCLSNAIMPKV